MYMSQGLVLPSRFDFLGEPRESISLSHKGISHRFRTPCFPSPAMAFTRRHLLVLALAIAAGSLVLVDAQGMVE